ncbi:hypothetical protein [Rhodococcus sp. T7]|uniref:hypothetical protein n=1 Tax=Rhodococcus sp. T7 TaxID=627444 RepID=UPI0013C86EBD|nr:hypothetical protein MLGJGCBP_09914 [Rhodococcus sp. T7]KAF0962054.1 hypothetical protein MLGJGCBP_04836 [Rhodococcus sp. T7]
MVTAQTAWKRFLLVCLVACAALVGTASPALAQEDPGPAAADTAGDLAMCAAVPIGGGGLQLALDALGAATGTEMPSCANGAQTVAEAPQNYVKKVATGAFETMGLSFGDAGAAVLKFALGWWITIPGQDENSFMATLGQVTQYTYWIQVAFLVVSLMFLGIRLMMARSGAIRDVSTEGVRQLARATVLAGSLGFIVVLGTRLSDNISRWFIDGTVGSDPDALVDAMIQIGIYASPGGTSLLYVIGIIGILGGLVMAFLLLMRMGLLVVITAALPIAGAAGGTKIGSQAYEKMIAWTLAFLLFKPVGSFVIGVAAMLFMQSAPSRDENGGAMTALIGALLLCSAALVLPSLMRLIVPAVGSLGGGGSGLAAAAGLAAVGAKVGGAIATGGASAGASGGAAAGGMTSASSTTTSPSGPSGAPPSFGTSGIDGGTPGANATGGVDGTPSNQSAPSGGNAAGGVDGTPTNHNGAPGAPDGPGTSGDGPTGAMPPSRNGGFEG